MSALRQGFLPVIFALSLAFSGMASVLSDSVSNSAALLQITSAAGPSTFTNPVLDADFPDPDVLRVGDTYYVYATNSAETNIQVARSDDLVHWELLSDALPQLPEWAVQDFGWSWAPEVTTFDGDTFVMYHVAKFAIGAGGRQCIGAATSSDPEGPFRPVGDEPLVCQLGEGGSIDASTFVDDDGTAYLLWKSDANCCGGQTWIYIQRLSDDGLHLEGESRRLITADRPWEGVLVEAPTLWRHGDRYYLFYSANDYASTRYAIGYAASDSLFGPYEKPAQPLLSTSIRDRVVGPGGQDVVMDESGETWLLYHAWTPEGFRNLNMVGLTWEAGIPGIAGSPADAQPAPFTGGPTPS